ncbi:MAG: cytochrome c [Bryobacteraceae bacterium]
MGRIPAAYVLVLALIPAARAHGPISTKLTWTREISRIVYKRCAGCHRPSGAAPMSFLSYDDARPWATAIKEEVLARRMPPWSAMKGFGEFQGDISLTAEEIHLLADWIEGGAPEGDAKYLPEPPAAPEKPDMGALRGIAVRGSLTLKAAMAVAAIQASGLPRGGSLQAVAVRPDGSFEPLLWIYPFHERWNWIYRYREPVRLPAGTRIEVTAPGSVVLSATR